MKTQQYSVVIIDDENICIDNLRNSFRNYPNFIIQETANNPSKGRELILDLKPDLVFLDVEMPQKTGLELLQEIQDEITWPMQVVFYTAYEKYLLSALRSSAFDFLLKPYETDEFDEVIKRYQTTNVKNSIKSSFRYKISQLINSNTTFMVNTVSGFQLFRLEQVLYFAYDKAKKQWGVVLTDQKYYSLKRGTAAEAILEYSPSFIQISQHQIVNIEYLCGIEDKCCKLIPPFKPSEPLIVSRTFMKELQERFYSI